MQLRRADVLDGAISILDEYGLGDLTMRRLATSLHVQPGALYWHFPNKQTLLGAIADHLLTDVDAPPTRAGWDEQVRELAHRLRDALLSRRDGAELVAATYASRLTTNRVRERIAAVCIRAGSSRSDAELTADTLLYYVLGQTVDEQSRMQMDSVGALTEEASPLFESPDSTSRFDFGLGLFIDGVRHNLGASARL
ncbi:TetR/AcrR family transcriptional regulator C-terminal domain-containing protein [Rhodococcus sp. H29-C3]|uniref:TetR/AcrR family transcriptional regulator C-terminal domain-containing protein n=1 Tax=Rhodococcus sp. H29-C3 TaxID=3046307 RepID=UPI0024BAE8A7|nr:TetR/AcrR family transcriptional regulator C-terminal domain-containing protein [Rhodococcus sp. H29-C3]MDJ0361037.1 TetR/AcrR family transcriptional regulator C-terminal domain-containing protein [Rhodococcus sp. H29-C3]